MNFPSTAALICFLAVFVLWAIHELYIEKNRNTNQDKLPKPLEFSNQVLTYGTLVSVILMFGLLYINLFVSDWFFYSNPLLSYLGSAIGFIGLIIRWWAINTLKDHFDTNIQIKENQELIRTGLFAIIRHPSYTGSLMTYVGLGIASLNLVTAMVLTVFILYAYYSRIRLEEKVLAEGFGNAYKEYRETTGALFPRISVLTSIAFKK